MAYSVKYGDWFFQPARRASIQRMKTWMLDQPQYQPETEHYFHAGMYCRKVTNEADVLIIGKVHKKEHFFLLVHGTMLLTTDHDKQRITGPHLLQSEAGTQRALYSETPVMFMTFHICKATTVEEAERELVEDDPDSPFGPGNILKTQLLEATP